MLRLPLTLIAILAPCAAVAGYVAPAERCADPVWETYANPATGINEKLTANFHNTCPSDIVIESSVGGKKRSDPCGAGQNCVIKYDTPDAAQVKYCLRYSSDPKGCSQLGGVSIAVDPHRVDKDLNDISEQVLKLKQ